MFAKIICSSGLYVGRSDHAGEYIADIARRYLDASSMYPFIELTLCIAWYKLVHSTCALSTKDFALLNPLWRGAVAHVVLLCAPSGGAKKISLCRAHCSARLGGE